MRIARGAVLTTGLASIAGATRVESPGATGAMVGVGAFLLPVGLGFGLSEAMRTFEAALDALVHWILR